jgi:hypothetical protein
MFAVDSGLPERTGLHTAVATNSSINVFSGLHINCSLGFVVAVVIHSNSNYTVNTIPFQEHFSFIVTIM